MSIATKNRRKITLGERKFIWYVSGDAWIANTVLHVVSYDKKFAVKYEFPQLDETRYLIVLGSEFPNLTKSRGGWIRVLCPKWEVNGLITPASVHSLIEWCLSEQHELMRVDWRGRRLLDTKL